MANHSRRLRIVPSMPLCDGCSKCHERSSRSGRVPDVPKLQLRHTAQPSQVPINSHCHYPATRPTCTWYTGYNTPILPDFHRLLRVTPLDIKCSNNQGSKWKKASKCFQAREEIEMREKASFMHLEVRRQWRSSTCWSLQKPRHCEW